MLGSVLELCTSVGVSAACRDRVLVAVVELCPSARISIGCRDRVRASG